MATGYELGGRSSIPGLGKEFVATAQCLESPAPLSNKYYGLFFLEENRPRRETGLSPVSISEIKNRGAVPSLPIHLHGVMLN
jgi:hypothetical protein